MGLSLYLPTWPSDLTRRRRHLEPRTAVVLSRLDHQREVVAACCRKACDAGVAVGMTVAHARALLPPGMHVEPADEARDARMLRRLGVWALRFVPTVAPTPPDGLFLDATGCERLYGGVGPLVRRVHRAVSKLGLAARIAAAPTWGGAWALARYGRENGVCIIEGGVSAALRPLPVAALRIDGGTVELLNEVGIEHVGDLMDLPRAMLAQRYGQEVPRRLDQALGEAFEVIEPIRPREPVWVRRTLEGPTDRLEAIEMVTRELLGQVSGQLGQRGCGCRELRVRLLRSDLPPVDVAVRTSSPTRDEKHLWSLLRPKVENANLGFGVEGVSMHASGLTRMSHQQETCWRKEPGVRDDASTARLVDTLAARLGTRGVLRVRAVGSHLPERAFLYEPVETLVSSCSNIAVTGADRPSLLLERPIPIETVLFAPDGPILSIRTRGESSRVTACIGPERIGPEWWRGGTGERDYFKVCTRDGRWLWIFRELSASLWFLHGEWA